MRMENEYFKQSQTTEGPYLCFYKLKSDIVTLEFKLKDSKKFKYTDDDFQKLKDDHKKELDEFENNFIHTLSPFL